MSDAALNILNAMLFVLSSSSSQASAPPKHLALESVPTQQTIQAASGVSSTDDELKRGGLK